MHCKYLPLSPYKALEKFSKALYGTKGGTYSARIFRPVMDASITNTQTLSRFSIKNCSTLSGSRFSKVESSDRRRLQIFFPRISLRSALVSGDALQVRIAKSKD